MAGRSIAAGSAGKWGLSLGCGMVGWPPAARTHRRRDEGRRRRLRGTTLLGRARPADHGPLHLGSAAGSTGFPLFFRRLRGDLVHWAGPRAPTIPGSLRAAVSGSCPINALQALHHSRSPAREPNGFTAGRHYATGPGHMRLRSRATANYPPVTARTEDRLTGHAPPREREAGHGHSQTFWRGRS